MPTPEECTNLKVAQASIDSRVESISERLDDVLEEIKGMRLWAARWGTILLLVAILGKDSIPIMLKLLGI